MKTFHGINTEVIVGLGGSNYNSMAHIYGTFKILRSLEMIHSSRDLTSHVVPYFNNSVVPAIVIVVIPYSYFQMRPMTKI